MTYSRIIMIRLYQLQKELNLFWLIDKQEILELIRETEKEITTLNPAVFAFAVIEKYLGKRIDFLTESETAVERFSMNVDSIKVFYSSENMFTLETLEAEIKMLIKKQNKEDCNGIVIEIEESPEQKRFKELIIKAYQEMDVEPIKVEEQTKFTEAELKAAKKNLKKLLKEKFLGTV